MLAVACLKIAEPKKQQMETQRNLIASLSAQLEDAQEAARHAGVKNAGE